VIAGSISCGARTPDAARSRTEVSAEPQDREDLQGHWRRRGLDLTSALAPIADHLASLRRRLEVMARRLPPEAAPPSERSLDPRG